MSLAIGKRGQNVRLGARLTGWDIDILTPAEYNKNLDDIERALKKVEGVEDIMLDKMLAIGIVSLADLAEIGPEPLVKELDMDEALAARVVETASEEAKRIAVETEDARKAAAEQLAAANSVTPAEPDLVKVDEAEAGSEVTDGLTIGSESPASEEPVDGETPEVAAGGEEEAPESQEHATVEDEPATEAPTLESSDLT